ncbi:peptidylprolyl isomerase [Limibacillus halophilus]|uniref:Parvulin-like PPIase n=1 Tax=Limibacillus halophilus TaxID=1579333 RepID=A0A839SU26_9PROT|nr:peptidylprolyl isomerase [Limibacillus halophilus]MBB3066337.1 peptidyl-prolyl cis-trans isomerase C [Limibacillus halophilus]
MTHSTNRRAAYSLAVFFAAAFLVVQPLRAQQDSAAAPTADSVVATVNGEDLTHGEVVAAAESLGPQYMANLDSVYQILVERLIDLRLVQQAALKAGLEDDAEVAERVESLRQQVVRDVFLERALNEAVTEAALQDRYAAFLEQNPPQTEAKARHILVETEEDAKAIIVELDGGADFAALARERSTGPSGAEGGDLGYFTADVMVPEFSQAAFALEPGSYTKTPIQTQFGWHVILVEDKRDTPPPSFEELRTQLSNELRQEAARKLVEDLRGTADIVLTKKEEAAPETGESDSSEGSETAPVSNN